MKALIVDDSNGIRLQLRQILEGLGHEIVAEAENGKEAIAQYARWHPDFVTLDIVMPEMDGLTALSEILRFDPHAKVIMATSAATSANELAAKEAGAVSFLSKPFQVEKLAEVLKRLEPRAPKKKGNP